MLPRGKHSVDRVTVQPTTQSPVVDKNIIATASQGKMKFAGLPRC